MALEKYNIEIEGLDYKEYDSNDLYFEINLYDLIKNKVSEPIVSSKYDGLSLQLVLKPYFLLNHIN